MIRGDNMDFRTLLIVFLAALLMRACWGTYRMMQSERPVAFEFPDEQQYWGMASSLASGDGLKDELGFRATRMPLYPSLLAPFTRFEGGMTVARAVQWIIGSLAAVLTALIAAALIGQRAGLIAGLLVAFDPFLVFFSSLLLTETLFVTGLTFLWWVAVFLLPGAPATVSGSAPTKSMRWWGATKLWIILGLVGSWCIYTRESTLGLFLVLVCFLVIIRRFDARTLLGAAISLAIVVVALVPWGWRNLRVTGDWCWLTHRAGISLYDGVGPQATGGSDLGDIKQMPAVAGLNEVEWNRHFLDESLKNIEDNPGRIVRLAGVKLARMWNPVPNVETYRSSAVRLVAAGWTLPVFGLALVGAVILSRNRGGKGWRILIFLLLPALFLSLLHSLFIGSVRYRLGAMPMLEMLAACALATMIDRLSRSVDRGVSRLDE
jgi:hypothetical protein